jgi:excisionase family DNA binding protein
VVKPSVREAARQFDVSRPTLVKRLKSGQLSGESVTGGGWLIDPAELIRAGYTARQDIGQVTGAGKIEFTRVAAGLPSVSDAEVAALKAALEAERIRREAAEALAAERLQHIDDLRRMLPPPEAKTRRWWPF